MKKQIVNKKGFTLIEVVVGFVICLVLLGVAFAVLGPIGNVFDRGGDRADAQEIAGVIFEDIRTDTNRCTTLQAGANNEVVFDGENATIGDTSEFYGVRGGELVKGHMTNANPPVPDTDNATSVYEEDFYGGKTIRLEAQDVTDSNNMVELTVIVLDEEGEELHQASGVLQPALVSGSQTQEQQPATDPVLAFLKSYGITPGNWQDAIEAAKNSSWSIKPKDGEVYIDYVDGQAIISVIPADGATRDEPFNSDPNNFTKVEAREDNTQRLLANTGISMQITETTIREMRREQVDWVTLKDGRVVWKDGNNYPEDRIPTLGSLYLWDNKLWAFCRKTMDKSNINVYRTLPNGNIEFIQPWVELVSGQNFKL